MSVRSGPEQKEVLTIDKRTDHRKALDRRRFVRDCVKLRDCLSVLTNWVGPQHCACRGKLPLCQAPRLLERFDKLGWATTCQCDNCISPRPDQRRLVVCSRRSWSELFSKRSRACLAFAFFNRNCTLQIFLLNKRHVCMKPCRPSMTNAHALRDGTETAFRQVHKWATICMHFQKSKHLFGWEVSWCDPACTHPKRSILEDELNTISGGFCDHHFGGGAWHIRPEEPQIGMRKGHRDSFPAKSIPGQELAKRPRQGLQTCPGKALANVPRQGTGNYSQTGN